ncbi:MAG: PQQ-like beta-propeller repeat protein, partial [Deinococcus sp.]|nr:PQQ-like beta-propeller repeat protein [Deinococcus sp.]
VMGRGKILYFGTTGTPWPSQPNDPAYETHAVYAIDTAGNLIWRYPSQLARLDNFIMSPPALSPDGKTLYLGTLAGDTSEPGKLIALDLTQPPGASDGERLKWELELRNPDRPLHPAIWFRLLAVGLDGRIYIAGAQAQLLGAAPVLLAVEDQGDQGAFVWDPAVVEPQGYPSNTGQFAGGLALWEHGGQVERIYFTTTHQRTANGVGGALFAIDPDDGSVLDEFDPAMLPSPGIGGMTAPTIGSNGTVYVGIRGKHPTAIMPAVNGHMYAVTFTPGTGFAVLWDFEVAGQLDWVPPAIGANGGLYFGSSDAFQPLFIIQYFDLSEIPPNTSPRFYAIFN